MSTSKFSQNLIKLKCATCKRINYYTRKNVKKVEKKLDISKFCSWCRKHSKHKESKR